MHMNAVLAAVVTLSALASPVVQQPRESASCQSDIVSSTVVVTFCGHREGDDTVLDLLIVWRGEPGWFQRRGPGPHGSSGSRLSGPGVKGVVSHSSFYGDVAIAFDANFDTRMATIARTTLRLDRVNTVVVDEVEAAGRVTATRWTEPALPLVGDWNLALAKRSSDFARDLQCDIPMPPPPPWPQVPILTVCDKLKRE
jgi:hypothetical protein